MGVSLVKVAEPIIEALPVRDTRAVGLAKAPLADDAGCVAGLFQQLGDGDIRRPQRHAGIASNEAVAGVQAGHQDAARGRTDRAAGIVLSKAHSLFGHFIQIRRLDLFLSKTAKVAVAKVVGQDKNYIWFFHGRRTGRPAKSARTSGHHYRRSCQADGF